MANPIIDLRKSIRTMREDEAELVEGESVADLETDEERGVSMSRAEGVEFLEWHAPEYEKKEHSDRWYLAAGSIALVMVILGILAGSYFFVTVVVLAFVVLIMYAKKSPREIYFAVSGRGVQVGKTVYAAQNLKSFWIFDRPAYMELSIEVNRAVSSFITIPLGDIDPDEVREILSGFLPEKEHKESYSDIFARRLGF